MRVLACLNAHDPSSTINVITPLDYLQSKGSITFTALLEREVRPWQVAQADVLVVSRSLEPVYRPIYEMAIELGIPMVHDLDDDLFSVPASDPNHGYYHHAARRTHMRWMLEQASLVRVHSPVLQAKVQTINSRTHLVRAGFDTTLLPDRLPQLSSAPIELVYATSRTRNDNLFPLIADDIRTLLRAYGPRIRLNLLGYRPADFRSFANVRLVPFEPDYRAFVQAFTRAGYAIGLAPMQVDDFHLSKTNTKFRDYAAAGAAGVYTDCALYRGPDSVVDGETGYLVDNLPGAWFAAISTMIEDPARIDRVRVNAMKSLVTYYSMDKAADGWLRDFQVVCGSHERAASDQVGQWWFNSDARAPSRVIEGGRQFYRSRVPARWRVRLRDLRLSLRRYIASWRGPA